VTTLLNKTRLFLFFAVPRKELLSLPEETHF